MISIIPKSIIPKPKMQKTKTGFLKAKTYEELQEKIVYQQDETMQKEQYSINVNEENVIIKSSCETGKFYAMQTLKQIAKVQLNDKNLSISCCEIEDKPRFSYRGFMLDESRHFFGMDVVKQTLDMMSMLKLNTFHWHLTDDQGWRIEIKKYPLLTKKGSIRKSTQQAITKQISDKKAYGEGLFYTQEQIKEIVAYAKSLHIEVIPEIDMPGHLIAAIACYPYLSCDGKESEVAHLWGVHSNIGCVGKGKIFEFVYDIIDELTELFPSKYFHIGGDEVPKMKWKKCPDCQAKIKELGLKNENELQVYFNNEVQKHLATKGKTLIGWNEILKGKNLSSDTVVQWWTGDCNKNDVKSWVQNGHKIILTHKEYVYMDHFYAMKDLRKTYSLDLDTVKLGEQFEKNVIGIEAPQWTEYVRDKQKFDFNTYPRLQALAEIGWTSKENKNFDDFENRLQYHMQVMDKLGIYYAKRDTYVYEGAFKIFKKAHINRQWITNTYIELELDKKKRK